MKRISYSKSFDELFNKACRIWLSGVDDNNVSPVRL